MRGEHVVGTKAAGGGKRMSSKRPDGGAFPPPHGEYEYPVEMLQQASGTSIFDPVLCELAYRWFCPEGGSVIDPFAGGSVRGIVAAKLGRQYTGIELRAEQVAANEEQARGMGVSPAWLTGDSLSVLPTLPASDLFDLVFTCPPYGDLEVYSDDAADLSAMKWPAFLDAYRAIIAASVARLRPDRFAVIVVGDFRAPSGEYRNFPGETIRAFLDAGCVLYNDAVLVTAVGSLPIRVGAQFSKNRKLGKTHQNVLVFFKGNTKAIPSIGLEFCPEPPTEADGA